MVSGWVNFEVDRGLFTGRAHANYLGFEKEIKWVFAFEFSMWDK
jgi:hypothetical protein